MIALLATCLMAQVEFPKNCVFVQNDTSRETSSIFRVPEGSVFVPQAFGKLSVIHDRNRFSIVEPTGQIKTIERYNLDKDLRVMSQEQLKNFCTQGYLSVKKIGNDYSLESRGRLLGGGPFLALATGLGVAIGGVACACTGNVPGMFALYYSAPLTIAAAAAAPTP